jgi:hypothetical protein
MIAYTKIGGILVLAIVLVCGGYHFGGLQSRTELADFQSKQAMNTANAVLAERASAQAQAVIDHNTELTHAQTIVQIDAAPAISTPVLLCEPTSTSPPSSPVPSTEGKAGGVAANPTGGGSQPVDRAVNIRPTAEELKKRLEKIMADYRQLDTEWPHGNASTTAH